MKRFVGCCFFFFPHFSLYLKDIKRRIISLEGALKRSLVGQVWPWLFLVHALVAPLDANLPWESFMLVCWPVIVLLSAYNPGFHQCEQLCNSSLYACWRSYATGGCLGVMVNQPWLHWLHTFSFDQGSSEEGLGCQRLVVPLQLGWLAGVLLGTPSTKWLWGADAFPPWVMQGSVLRVQWKPCEPRGQFLAYGKGYRVVISKCFSRYCWNSIVVTGFSSWYEYLPGC